MTQHVLMILPSTEDEKPRMVGPFLTEATANAWADTKEIDPVRRVIRPLESPTSIYGYGRHALIPSPTPRRVVAGALAAWEAKKEEARSRDTKPLPDLAAGGRPITSWIEQHADQLQRFVPQELPRKDER